MILKTLTLAILFILIFSRTVHADSSYVLPYPSFMPGNPLYKVNLIKDEILKYWYFGSFGQFKYNLKQADKYLVEAKTLFEYKQYVLARTALQKSDRYFEEIYPNLLSAKNHGKNISENESTLRKAAQKHIDEITKLKSIVPSTFDWTPEREKPKKLNLWESLNKSIELRAERL